MTTRAALGIDLGTRSVKAAIVTLDGHLLGLGRRAHPTMFDATTGLAEQDPEQWWAGVVTAVRDAVGAASRAGNGRTPAATRSDDLELVGLAVAGHGPTFVPVDATGLAVRPAITWQDRRSGAEANQLAEATGRTGWGLGILPPARWLEGHEPDAAAATRWYLNSWEAITLRMTGVAAAVTVGAAESPPVESLRRAGLRVERIPAPTRAGTVVGPLLPAVARELGLPAGLPVVAGVVDAYASLHGARMLEAGDAIDVGGAAGGFGMYWDMPIEATGSFTAPAPLPGLWLVGGAMVATGAALEWLQSSVLGGSVSVPELLGEARSQPAGTDGLVFLPYLAGERSPIWDPSARGAFVGLTLQHGRAAMTRAVLEGAAFALRHVATGIEAAGGTIVSVRVCGGPARDEGWNRIKADVLRRRVEVPRILETAAVGSAILAAVGTRAQPDLPAAIRAMATIDHVIEPDPSAAERYDDAFSAYLRVYPALVSARTPRDAVATAGARG